MMFKDVSYHTHVQMRSLGSELHQWPVAEWLLRGGVQVSFAGFRCHCLGARELSPHLSASQVNRLHDREIWRESPRYLAAEDG